MRSNWFKKVPTNYSLKNYTCIKNISLNVTKKLFH